MRIILLSCAAASLAVLLAAGSASAQTFRSLSASPTSLVFAEEPSIKRGEMNASVRVFVVYAPAKSNGMASQDMTLSFDCGSMEASVGEQVAYRANLAELARAPEFGAAFRVATGSIFEPVLNYACQRVTPPSSATYVGRANAVAAGQRILAARAAGN